MKLVRVLEFVLEPKVSHQHLMYFQISPPYHYGILPQTRDISILGWRYLYPKLTNFWIVLILKSSEDLALIR